MKFVDSSYEIIKQESGLDGLKKQIEKAARISYKSEDKITNESAEKMVNMLIKNNHGAALEHGTVYLKLPPTSWNNDVHNHYMFDPYSVCNSDDFGSVYITTNFRVIIENHFEDDLQYICDPTEFHEKRYSVKFILSAGIGREFTRHRSFSFLQESSRFCNYSKGKFDYQLTFIIPQWIYKCQAERASYIDSFTGESKDWLMELHGQELIKQMTCEDRSIASYVDLLQRIEEDYMFFVSSDESYKLKPEEARGILPLDIKSELFMTGFASDWIHFFNLRSYIAMTGKPHPDAMILANNLLNEFLNRNYIKYEELYKKVEI